MGTFGKTDIGSVRNSNGGGGAKRGSLFQLTEDAVVSRVSHYIGVNAGTGSCNFRCGIYRASTGALIGSTQSINILGTDADAWRDFFFTAALSLSADMYWLMSQDDVPTGTMTTSWLGDLVGTNTFFANSDAYTDGLANPMGANTTGNANRTASIYAVYDTSSYIASLGRRPVPMIKGPDRDTVGKLWTL